MFQKGEGGANGNGTISDFFASRDGSKSGMITEFPNEPARLSVPIGSTCEAEAISPLSSSRHSLPQYSSPLRSSPPQSSSPLQSSSRLQSPPPLLVLSDSSDGQEPIRQFKINPSSWITFLRHHLATTFQMMVSLWIVTIRRVPFRFRMMNPLLPYVPTQNISFKVLLIALFLSKIVKSMVLVRHSFNQNLSQIQCQL